MSADYRCFIAPHIWPYAPYEEAEYEAPPFYISWPGWELFISRHFKNVPGCRLAQPFLLAGTLSPEEDCRAIECLVNQAAELGPSFWPLERPSIPETADSLAKLIKNGEFFQKQPAPRLDDRLYLALWTFTEYQAWQADLKLAQISDRVSLMLGELKGEEPDVEQPLYKRPALDHASPSAQLAFARQRWLNLAGPCLKPDDVIIPPFPTKEE